MSAPIRYLDVCSGYSAFTVASAGMGFECAGYAEVDAFPSALLGHHYGAGRARYMPDPDAPFIDAKERNARLGLIKSMASRMADLGISNQGIKSVGGWSADSEVSLYTKAADQTRLADDAIGRVAQWEMANREDGLAIKEEK